jgi:RNA polymerase sigma factor (sigma-70 family)
VALIKPPPKTEGLTDDELQKCLKTLTPREETVLTMRWGLDGEVKSCGAIGELYGVRRERIRQIEKKALRKMEHCKELLREKKK